MKFVDGKILSFDQQIKQKRGPYYEKFIEKQNQLKINIALEKAEKKNQKIEEKNKKRVLENLPLIKKINLNELKNKVERTVLINTRKLDRKRQRDEDWKKSKELGDLAISLKTTIPEIQTELLKREKQTELKKKEEARIYAREYQKKNYNKVKENIKKYKDNPEVKERLRVYNREYHKKNRQTKATFIGPKPKKVFKSRGRPISESISAKTASKLLLNNQEAILLKKQSTKFIYEDGKSIREQKNLAKKIFIDSLRNKENKSEVEKAFIKIYEYHEKIKKWKKSDKGKETIKKQSVRYYNQNKDKLLNYAKIRTAKGLNKEWERKYKPQYIKKRRQEVPIFRLISNVRSRFKSYLILKKINKENKTLELIGCSPQELRNHIEKYFRKGMSWENYGIDTWHIDHIRPLSLAKSWDDIVRLKLMHYTNLRPLWAKENLQKSDK